MPDFTKMPVYMGTPEEAPEAEPYLIKRGKVRNVYGMTTRVPLSDEKATGSPADPGRSDASGKS